MDTCPKCASDNTDWGYGLAGGGMGAYSYCKECGHIFNKTNEVEMPETTEKVLPSSLIPAEDIERVAIMCHEVNKTLCLAVGDTSQFDWDNAPEWQKDSARKGVIFNIDNPHAPASASHESWMEEKFRTGWGYGPVKNENAKTHPCLVSHDELPPEQKVKDAVFKAIVNNMLATYVNIGVSDYDVEIAYTNFRGEAGIRRIRPDEIFFGPTKWHPIPQWIVTGYDYGKAARRSFALQDIASWKPNAE